MITCFLLITLFKTLKDNKQRLQRRASKHPYSVHDSENISWDNFVVDPPGFPTDRRSAGHLPSALERERERGGTGLQFTFSMHKMVEQGITVSANLSITDSPINPELQINDLYNG